MFPRLPRLLRGAVLVLSLVSLVFLLRMGVQDKMVTTGTGNSAFHTRMLSPSAAVQGLLPSTAKFFQLTSRIRALQNQEQSLTTFILLRLLNVTASTTRKQLRPEDIKNPHNFHYLLNPEGACRSRDGGHVSLLVYVHAAPANFKKRQTIRQTWGDQDVLRKYNATLVFIMGSVQDKPQLMDLVRMESERYGDIVQEDFVDTYRNLTYKAVAGLKWAAKYCSKAEYILKSDDDILVNLHRVVQYIRDTVEPTRGRKKLILCNQWLRMKILRDKKSKWYIPEEDFPGEYFPPYCSGSAFILSGDMAQAMYEASLMVPFFWVDDYYITGALIKHLGLSQVRLNDAYSINPSVAEGKYKNDTKKELFFFHLHKLGVFYNLWKNMTTDYHLQHRVLSSRAAATFKSNSVLPPLTHVPAAA